MALKIKWKHLPQRVAAGAFILNSGIGNGATNKTIDLAGLKRLQRWVGSLKPPAYPFPVDHALAA